MRELEAEAVAAVERLGLESLGVLGAGIEGVVVAISDDTVAKVWSRRSHEDLVLLRGFYDAIDPPGPGPALPRIDDVLDAGGTSVTIERRLAGRPLWEADGSSPVLTTHDVDAMTEALGTLAAVPGSPALRSLPVLPGEPAFGPARPFELELADLVRRRTELCETSLAAALPEVDRVAAGTIAALHALTPAAPTLVHGDLIAANVLVADGRASAVLDFGFLSTAGDPAFDAAVAASVYDMWGPRAREVERRLDAAFTSSFGHDPARLATYRAAYALVTACCFGTDLSDGHFGWCVAMLGRGDVREAVGQA
ncbi:aminoglycoside phosphotransferase family protein [Nocardioides oleivorans]|uniref:Aminoglycoside phosphotransferase family protein n=1 Tax=Nocardioides oleivorans TaxID=273676 RepID=A0A4Q2RXT6_9ACTN|nr:phosphotransferase [Nocardioides oleivorans]RYB93596.1 aminoglycoside phosphotransferase family protein [Nocardioides oleivorans]